MNKLLKIWGSNKSEYTKEEMKMLGTPLWKMLKHKRTRFVSPEDCAHFIFSSTLKHNKK
jgi:hypothetical protein